MIRIGMYNEYLEEKNNADCRAVYPKGIHGAIGDYFANKKDVEFKAVTHEDENCGITDEFLSSIDVLLWWGHGYHNDVSDEVTRRVVAKVNEGMGFIGLHSAHYSKPFKALMGTGCTLHWCDNQREIMWTVTPAHPIAKGIPEYFELECEEMYGEPFGIPNPEEVIFMGWFNHGNVFRSGVTYRRGNGKIFYFQPGHNTNRAYYDENVLKIIENAAHWAKPEFVRENITQPQEHFQPDKINIMKRLAE